MLSKFAYFVAIVHSNHSIILNGTLIMKKLFYCLIISYICQFKVQYNLVGFLILQTYSPMSKFMWWIVFLKQNLIYLLAWLNWLDIYISSWMSGTGKSLSEALLFAEHGENMLCTKIHSVLFCVSETISVHNMFSPGLSLEFSCIELVIQLTICRHIVMPK